MENTIRIGFDLDHLVARSSSLLKVVPGLLSLLDAAALGGHVQIGRLVLAGLELEEALVVVGVAVGAADGRDDLGAGGRGALLLAAVAGGRLGRRLGRRLLAHAGVRHLQRLE